MKRTPMKRSTPLSSKPNAWKAPPKPRAVMAPCAGPAEPKPKPATHRGASWLAAVRSLSNCVLCGAQGVEPAHRNEGKGGAIKAHDCWTAALCRQCHREIDQGRTLTREERRAAIDRAIVLTLAELVQTGKVAVVR